MLRKITRVVKNALLPSGPRFRRLPLGLAAGTVMKIDFRNQTILYLGLYEIELNPYFRFLVQKGYKCFDIGGQGGYDALMLAKLSGGPVVSFECNPEAARIMRDTFAQNPYQINVIETFVSNKDNLGCMTIDSAAAKTFIPDFIKMDIEGTEVEALRGAPIVLSTRKPSLIIEVHGLDKEIACIDLLRSYGYEPRVVNQRWWLREQRSRQHNRWLICQGHS